MEPIVRKPLGHIKCFAYQLRLDEILAYQLCVDKFLATGYVG